MKKTLTKAEEQIMQVLWQLENATVAEVIEAMPEPKPHYNTVSTLVKIMIEKKFVSFKAIGRSHIYAPAISKDSYAKQSAKAMLKNYFEGGVAELISFFVKEKDISINELEEIMKTLKKK
jgi:BlaI family transcriptional regulator, penicillinase repressor